MEEPLCSRALQTAVCVTFAKGQLGASPGASRGVGGLDQRVWREGGDSLCPCLQSTTGLLHTSEKSFFCTEIMPLPV